MDFEIPRFERVPIKETNAKDVNQLFKYVAEIGFGTYGRVYKAFSKTDSSIYALKKLIIYHEKENQKGKEYEKDGFPITALREIKFLQKLDHPNIIKLHQIVISSNIENVKSRSSSTYLVFEFMDHDFLGLINAKFSFTLAQIKYVMLSLLRGVEYLHSKKIIHRDIKSANILYNNKGEVKIADFGLARFHNKDRKYTNEVVTLWYRAPELLLGSQTYDTQIDMWSVGCFFGELMIGDVMFKGDKNSRQLELIYEKCGSPDELNWPGVKSFSLYDDLGPKKYYPRVLHNFIRTKPNSVYNENAIDLLDKLLLLCPEKRINATEALAHPFFNSEPHPCDASQMPVVKQGELHGPLKMNVVSKNNVNNARKEDLNKFELISKKIKKD